MSLDRDLIHLIAGGCGGTMGAIATCPLEVVKTRLQSSSFCVMAAYLPPPAARQGISTTCQPRTIYNRSGQRQFCTSRAACTAQVVHLSHQLPDHNPNPRSLSLLKCIKYIIDVEGPGALWRGLGPNLVGVAPSRAIYFCSYSKMRNFLTKQNIPDGPLTSILSASCAGFTSCTFTNPIWFIKTRLQLSHASSSKKITTLDCIRQVYATQGILGFYKGLTASYYGISETVVHFVIYESIKAKLAARRQANPDHKTTRDFVEFMLAGAISKSVASTLCYPHEVARTRLRECGNKYTGFWQTLALVLKEEGWHGLYRGLATQLVRQIPNTAIMMSTYEGVVYLLTKYYGESDEFYEDDEFETLED